MDDSYFLSQSSSEVIQSAAQTLSDGNLVAFPTETVYGLGADATNAEAVAKIYKTKGRPTNHPLIVHLHTMQAVESWVSEFPSYAIALARDFWPGPMTLILKREKLAQDFITGGQDSVGVRIPNHPIALALLHAAHKLGVKGVVAPSANRFGHVSPTTSDAVRSELSLRMGAGDQILDGGQSLIGLESTIIDCSQKSPQVLRPGAITIEMILNSTGLEELKGHDLSIPIVSGSLEKHYSPKATVLLDVVPLKGQGYIAMASFPTPPGVVRLSAPENEYQFAREFYGSLRKADELGFESIVVQLPIGAGIAIAIRDRALRASKGR